MNIADPPRQALARLWPDIEGEIDRIQRWRLPERPLQERVELVIRSNHRSMAERLAALQVDEKLRLYSIREPRTYIRGAKQILGGGHWVAKNLGDLTWLVERRS